MLVSLSYNAMKGEPDSRLFTVTEPYLRLADPNRTTPLAQGNMTIMAEKAWTYYLPSINVMNLRAQKEFVIKDTQRLHLMVNISIYRRQPIGVVQSIGRFFRGSGRRQRSHRVRFGTRFTF